MGIGKPVISCEFNNSDLFPQMVLDEKQAAENTGKKQNETSETAAAAFTSFFKEYPTAA